MTMMRDVWVNWFEGEENGYNVCDFHEWRSEDRVEVLDQVVLVETSEALFEAIENQLSELPASLLGTVHQKSYLRKNMSRIQLDYCFIATDGVRIIAVDTMGYKTPIRKSRLTPRQEQLVFDALKEQDVERITQEQPMAEKEYHLLSPDPKQLKGLTRRERQLKQLLYMSLDHLRTTGTDAELRYWCTEWDPFSYHELQHMGREQLWNHLYMGVSEGWTKTHYELCEAMIKGQAFFEKLWELEHPQRVK
ncbi:YjbA family protein [Shouchella shacheensis]|uniref:YjbA family protein n=1 Tax=Shouchella shacheensis TaxID=1649580 RepID=UPI0007400B30|nr:YjbA family protein [Shouchella shacheensis]